MDWFAMIVLSDHGALASHCTKGKYHVGNVCKFALPMAASMLIDVPYARASYGLTLVC